MVGTALRLTGVVLVDARGLTYSSSRSSCFMPIELGLRSGEGLAWESPPKTRSASWLEKKHEVTVLFPIGAAGKTGSRG